MLRPILLTALLTSLLLGAGLLAYRALRPSPGIEILLPTPPAATIKVYVTGAVRAPGVYALAGEPRIKDALEAAGGATLEADLTALNLAVRVRDEQHIHIPKPGEVPPSSSAEERININTASAAVLETLPGVGPVRATRIIEHRRQNGPFQRIEELVELKLVPASDFEKFRESITVR